ncbi:MAG: PAS domain-containing hybrid sensor histidine kinase/response regulator, partial [Desulfomonilaceae bacterium]
REAIYVKQGGSIKFMNQAFLRLTGFSKAELLDGNAIEAAIHPDDKKIVTHFHTRRLKGDRSSHEYQLRLVCKDNSLKWLDVESTLIMWQSEPADLCVLSDISERKKLEMLESIVDSLPVAISFMDCDGRYILRNRTHKEWWDEHTENILELTVRQVMGDQHESFHANGLSALAGKKISTETTIKFGNGVTRDILSRIAPYQDTGGEIKGLVEFNTDMTDMKIARQKDTESKTDFRCVYENLTDGVLLTSLDGKILMVNPAACRFFERTEAEICQLERDQIRELMDPDLTLLLEMLKRNGRIEHEVNLKQSGGKSIQTELTGSIFRFRDDRESAILCFRDVTARKRSNENVRQIENKYRKLTELLPLGIFELDITGRFTFANPALKLLHGHNQDDDLAQLCLMNVVVTEDQTRLAEDLKKLISGETILSGEYLGMRKDGTTFPILVNAVPIFENDEIAGFSGAISDISLLKETERKKEMMLTQFLQAQKLEALNTLVGGLAHDLNNILQIILGYSQLLLEEKKKGEPDYEDLQTIVLRVKEAAQLIEKLMAFSQKGPAPLIPLSLNNMVKDLTTSIRHSVGEAVDIQLELANSSTMIRGNRYQLDQVIMNLVLNAADAMSDQGKLTISTEEAPLDEECCSLFQGMKPGTYTMLSIRDTGRGMDEKTLTRIFEPFFTTKQRGSSRGTGLGLSVTQGIVQQHGGFITCKSETGRGTEFKVYFPSMAASDQPIKSVIGTDQVREIRKVLIVENNPVVAEVVKKSLEWLGYSVIVASSEAEAVESYKARKEEISLVIINFGPEISAKECLMELIKVNPTVKVLISSNYDPKDGLHTEIRPFVKGFIYRPFGLAELDEAVGRVLHT